MKRSLMKISFLIFIMFVSIKAYPVWDSTYYFIKQKIFDRQQEQINLDTLKLYYKKLHYKAPDSTIQLLRSMYFWSKNNNHTDVMHQVLPYLSESLLWSPHIKNANEIMYGIFDGIDYASKNDDSELLIKYYTLLSVYFRSQDNYKQAYFYHLLALEEAKKNNDILNIIAHNYKIGDIFFRIKLYADAIKALNKNMKLEKKYKIADNSNIMLTHVLLMKAHSYINNTDSVEYFYKIVLRDTSNSNIEWTEKYSLYNFLGDYYLQIGNIKKAEKIYKNIIKVLTNHKANFRLGHIYTRIAYVNELHGKHTDQLKYNILALNNRRKYDSKTHLGSSYANLANSYINLSQPDSAIFFLMKALQIHKNREAIDHYLPYDSYKLYEYYENTRKNTDSALKYYRLYNIFTDSLNAQKNQQKLQSMNFDWMFKEKQLKLQQLRKENQIKTFAIISLSVIFVLVITISVLIVKQFRQRNRSEHIELRDKIVRSQLNPHFIFNSLIAIQGYVYQNKAAKAGGYIADFAKLMRHFLNNSRSDLIMLKDETETLHYYFRLQSIRFKDKLDFSITLDPKLNLGKTLIPPGLAQPFIENAIEHGIQHKEGRGNVDLRIFMIEKTIYIEIEDDGIGYKSNRNTKKGNNHLSLATLITQERIDNMNKRFKGKEKIKFNIKLANPEHKYPGTLVTFTIPEKMMLKQ